VAEPILEARRADTRVTARGEALIVQLYAEVTCVDVCDHLTWVLVCAQVTVAASGRLSFLCSHRLSITAIHEMNDGIR